MGRRKMSGSYVTYQEGTELYSMGICTFMKLAREAKATRKIKERVLVSCELFEQYLEQFRVADYGD